MSSELIKARTQISKINTFLKQDKIMPAVRALAEALVTILRNPLMRNEKEEFSEMLHSAVATMNHNPAFRRCCPVQLEYTAGKEKELLLLLKELKAELEKNAVDEAQDQLAALQKKRAEGLEKGAGMITGRQYEAAEKHFRSLVQMFPDDAELKGEIGELFLKAQRYEEAYEYLAQALEQSPESLHLYNRIGIALRKMGRFEVAERYFSQALDFTKGDPNLYFNIGRLYVDWRKWDKVEKMAKRALKYNPDFVEAKKMLTFAKKKMGGG